MAGLLRHRTGLVRGEIGAVWLPLVLGLLLICGESTQAMGGVTTARWLTQGFEWMHWQAPRGHEMVILNVGLRKTGHVFGYGVLGLILGRAWISVLGRRLGQTWAAMRVRGALLGVVSVTVVAIADEIHQSFLPGRTATVHDVVLDTVGALVVNAAVYGMVAARRKSLRRELRSARRMRAYGTARLRQTDWKIAA